MVIVTVSTAVWMKRRFCSVLARRAWETDSISVSLCVISPPPGPPLTRSLTLCPASRQPHLRHAACPGEGRPEAAGHRRLGVPRGLCREYRHAAFSRSSQQLYQLSAGVLEVSLGLLVCMLPDLLVGRWPLITVD